MTGQSTRSGRTTSHPRSGTVRGPLPELLIASAVTLALVIGSLLAVRAADRQRLDARSEALLERVVETVTERVDALARTVSSVRSGRDGVAPDARGGFAVRLRAELSDPAVLGVDVVPATDSATDSATDRAPDAAPDAVPPGRRRPGPRHRRGGAVGIRRGSGRGGLAGRGRAVLRHRLALDPRGSADPLRGRGDRPAGPRPDARTGAAADTRGGAARRRRRADAVRARRRRPGVRRDARTHGVRAPGGAARRPVGGGAAFRAARFPGGRCRSWAAPCCGARCWRAPFGAGGAPPTRGFASSVRGTRNAPAGSLRWSARTPIWRGSRAWCRTTFAHAAARRRDADRPARRGARGRPRRRAARPGDHRVPATHRHPDRAHGRAGGGRAAPLHARRRSAGAGAHRHAGARSSRSRARSASTTGACR